MSTLKPVDTAAALASRSTTRPPLSQPSARALPLLVVSGRSPFETSSQPFNGRHEAEHLRPNPLQVRRSLGRDQEPQQKGAYKSNGCGGRAGRLLTITSNAPPRGRAYLYVE